MTESEYILMIAMAAVVGFGFGALFGYRRPPLPRPEHECPRCGSEMRHDPVPGDQLMWYRCTNERCHHQHAYQ